MADRGSHGGKRAGAGRPKGSRSRRSEALADKLLGEGKCPVDALVRLAEAAEKDGDRKQAIDAWKSILPYVHAKPKAVDIDPNSVIELARAVAEVRADASRQVRENSTSHSYLWLLERATELGLQGDLPAQCFEEVAEDDRV